MIFTYYEYLNYGVVVPLLIAAMLLVCLAGCSVFLYRKKKSPYVVVIPILILLGLYIVAILLGNKAWPFLEKLYSEKHTDPIFDIVQIEEVEEGQILPIFYGTQQRRVSYGAVIHTNRGDFYCIDVISMTIGDYVALEYFPESRVVLGYEIQNEDAALSYWKQYPNAPQISVQEGNVNTGKDFAVVLVVFFLITVKDLVISSFASKIMERLWAYDRQTSHIGPRFFGIINAAYMELVFVVGCVYAFCVGSVLSGIILLMVTVGAGYYMVQIISTRIWFSDEGITFRSIGSFLFVERENITDVRWQYPRRASTKALYLYTHSGKEIQLSILYFVGLRAFLHWWEEDETW